MLTEEQLRIRRSGIAATDMVTLAMHALGESTYGSPLDVYASKVGDAPSWAGNMRTEAGNAMEPVMLRHLAKTHDLTCIGGRTVRSKLYDHFLATPDDIAIDADKNPCGTLETKLVGRRMCGRWFEPGEDAPVFPTECLIQVAWQMGVMRTSREFERSRVNKGYLGALLGDFGEDAFHSVVFPWEGEIEKLWWGLQTIADRFWNDHVVARVPPPADATDRATEALLRLYPRINREVLDPADEVVEAKMTRYLEILEAEGALKTEKKLVGNELRACIGDREGFRGIGTKCTWKPQDGVVSASKLAAHFSLSEEQLKPFRGEGTRVLRVAALTKKEISHVATAERLAG